MYSKHTHKNWSRKLVDVFNLLSQIHILMPCSPIPWLEAWERETETHLYCTSFLSMITRLGSMFLVISSKAFSGIMSTTQNRFTAIMCCVKAHCRNTPVPPQDRVWTKIPVPQVPILQNKAAAFPARIYKSLGESVKKQKLTLVADDAVCC